MSEIFREIEFNCFGKNTEKYIGFSVESKKTEVKINRKTKEQNNKDIKDFMNHS